jgi:[NiFe] hydrogenase small subunit
MNFSVGLGRDDAEKRLERSGVSRRDFMKFCATVAAAMGMGPSFAPKVAQALTAKRRPSVVWLHNAECTGCTEAAIRTIKPFIDALILDTISLDYQETIMAAAGEAAEDALHKAVESKDGFYLVIEGGLPTIDGGQWGMVSGHPMIETTKKLAPKAKGIICIGTCSAYGGVQKAKPNPSQAKGVAEALGAKTINIAGCPPNPSTSSRRGPVPRKGHPELDNNGRPKMSTAIWSTTMTALKHIEASEFAPSSRVKRPRGYCLYELCARSLTYNNCPSAV